MGDNKDKVSANTPTTDERQEHLSIIPVSQEVVIDKCVDENCCDGRVHCPFCDTDHFKPTKPTRVRDHLELLHMSYAVQAEDLIIVKCFWNCDQAAGHYHCPYCPSKLLKRYAFTLHLYTHMHKLGKDKSCIVVPDPKNPATIKGLGPEIHLCKKEECYKEMNFNNENSTEANGNNKDDKKVAPDLTALSSTTLNPEDRAAASFSSTTTNEINTVLAGTGGPHYHCPLCNLICKRRSPLINHLWRCKERPRSSQPTVDENWKKAINLDQNEADKVPHPRDIKEIKYHISIVRTLNDLPITKCMSPDCDCGHRYHCPLCVEDRFKPNYLCHLQLHYYAHWKRRVKYKDYSVLLCNNWCELKTGCHKIRYHFHCPICGATRRRRKGFVHHLEICNGHQRPSSRRLLTQGLNEDAILTSSSAIEEEEEEEEGEEEGLEEDEILGLDEQFTTDLMMVRDEEAEDEGEGERGGGTVEVEDPKEGDGHMIVSKIMVDADDDSTTKIDQSKKNDSLEDINYLGDTKLSAKDQIKGIIELPPSQSQTETTLQLIKEEIYDQVSARLSSKFVDAFREKGNVDEIFSSIALHTGAEWSYAPEATIDDNMSVHKFVGNLQSLVSTRDLLFQTLVGNMPYDKIKSDSPTKQTTSERMNSTNPETHVMDASVQVEDSSFTTSTNIPPKSAASSKKPQKMSISPATGKPALKGRVRKKRGRPKKVPLSSEVVVNSTDSVDRAAKERNMINVEESSLTSFLDIMNFKTNSEIILSPKMRGQRKKIFNDKPDTKEMNTADNSINMSNQVESSGITAVADISGNADLETLVPPPPTPEKKKRGRPRKDKKDAALQIEVDIEAKSRMDVLAPPTHVSDTISSDSPSTPKRYSTRGKRIDLSFLTGKTKREDVLKVEADDGSSRALLQESKANVKRDLYGKNTNSHQSTADEEDNDDLDIRTDGNSASKIKYKKSKTRAPQPLILSDVALLPTIRVDITQRRGQKKKKGIEKKIRTLVERPVLSAPVSGEALLTSGTEISSPLSKGTATSELKLVSGLEEGLYCHLCKIKGERFDEITDHLKTVHGVQKPIRCDVCERTFEKLFDLRSHVNRKHGPFPQMDTLSCFKCGKVFLGTAKLNWHLSFIHKITREPTPKKTPWPCNHNNDSKLCNLCGKVFSKGNHLVTHIQAVHTKEKAAECTICNKKFNHIRYLRTHMKRHEGIKKHQCPTCGWRFFESNTLKDHMETHKEASKRRYRFTCDYCGQKYISKANFSDHLNKHTGEKPHKCQVCGKGFAFRTMLMKHQIHIHTTEKPFKCTYCERAFKFKAKLLQHTVIHTGVSKYVCQSCNKPFSCAATLKHHQPRCRGVTSWVQNKTVVNEGLTLMVDGLALEHQQNQQATETSSGTVEIPVGEDQNDIVIDMSGLTGMPEGSILQAAAQAAQLMEIPEVFMCSECNAVFSSLEDAEVHVTSFHTDVVAVASTGVVEAVATDEIKVMEVEEPAVAAVSSDYIDTTLTVESGST